MRRIHTKVLFGLQGASVVGNILMIQPREMIQFDYYFNQVGWESQTSSVFFILKKYAFLHLIVLSILLSSVFWW